MGLPVLVGRGSDPELMGRLSLPKARAVAAVTADDLENIRRGHGRPRGAPRDTRRVAGG